MIRSIAPFLSILSLTAAQGLLPTEECPLLGPTFSSDFDLTKTDAFTEAKAAFPDVIDALFESGTLNASLSSFVLDVYSTVTNTSIYSYSHQASAPALNESFPAGGIDDETIFRIGSVSKLYTVYAILAHAGGVEVLDHPVIQYLPELAGNARDDPLKRIVWEDVTVGTLASHMAGTGNFPITQVVCFSADDETCNTADFLAYMRQVRTPSQPIHQSSLYSDGGFGVLGRVLERMTGQTYNEAIQSVLGKPLGLNSTVSIMPAGEDLNAIVIPMEELGSSAWGFDNQITAPSGGLYSTSADFRATGLSILHSQLLAPATTRSWMKPRAHLSSLASSVGAPWEINRLALPISADSARTRVSDLYTKSGGQPGYTAVFAMSPDHGLGYSVLVAGPTAGIDRWTIRAAVGQTFVTAAEQAAMENARRHFAGTFADEAGDGTKLTLTVDEDHPGLGLPQFSIDGADARPNITTPGFELPEGLGLVIRLYPTGLDGFLEDGGKQLKYRAVAELTPLQPRARIEGGEGLFNDGCISWSNTAFFEAENGQFYDEFVFEVDRKGDLTSVSYPVRGKVMKRL